MWMYRTVHIEKTSVILHCCQCWQEHETASWLKKHKRRLDQLEAQTYNWPSGLLTTPRLKGCTLSHPQWLPALVMIDTWLSWLSHDCHMIVMTVTPTATVCPGHHGCHQHHEECWSGDMLSVFQFPGFKYCLSVFFLACDNENVIAEVMKSAMIIDNLETWWWMW